MSRNSMSGMLYVGTYTRQEAHVDGHGDGIYVYQFDPATGQLRHQSTFSDVVNPSFLAIEPQGKYLYAVNELTHEEESAGTVSAFAIDAATGDLRYLNKQSSGGLAPAYVSTDNTGQHAFVANYATGNVAVLPVQPNGELRPISDIHQHHGSGPDARQDGPHAHSILPDPDGRYVLSANLGNDRIMIYGFDPSQGRLLPHQPTAYAVSPGSGPRHLAFHPNKQVLYAITECSSQIYVLAYDAQRGALAPLQTLSTVPEGYAGFSAGADIHLSSDGRFLYTSIRGQDSIAIYATDGETGKLTLVASESTQGKTPRNFAIDPTGRYLLAANQDSDSVVIFRIHPDNGRLTPTGESYSIPSPVCLRFPPK
jgi:6-phosphogluconolactonase